MTDANERPALDPEAALRLLSDVQRYGLQAATDVAGRFSRLAADEALRFGAKAGIRPDLATVTANLEAGWESFNRVLDQSFGATSSTADSTDTTAPGLTCGPFVPGSSAVVDIWLHNMAGWPRQVAAIRVSEMLSNSGDSLTESAVTANTATPLVIEVGGSTKVELAVEIPPDSADGAYHGLVFAPPHGDAPLSLVITVAA